MIRRSTPSPPRMRHTQSSLVFAQQAPQAFKIVAPTAAKVIHTGQFATPFGATRQWPERQIVPSEPPVSQPIATSVRLTPVARPAPASVLLASQLPAPVASQQLLATQSLPASRKPLDPSRIRQGTPVRKGKDITISTPRSAQVTSPFATASLQDFTLPPPKKVRDDSLQASGITVPIGFRTVPVTAEDDKWIDKAVNEVKFKDWCNALGSESRLEVKSLHIQSIDMFGPKVGFIKLKADASCDKQFVPGIVFMRGGAAAILVILRNRGKLYTVLARQPRVPIGDSSFPEIPAGMFDGDNNFAGAAAKELREETGIEINQNSLIDLTALRACYGEVEHPGIYPTCGASDEFYRIFAFRMDVNDEELDALNGKLTGLAEEGEMIKLQILPFEDLWRVTADSKSLVALCLYQKLTDIGAIQPF